VMRPSLLLVDPGTHVRGTRMHVCGISRAGLHERGPCTAALSTLIADEFDVLNGGQPGCDGR